MSPVWPNPPRPQAFLPLVVLLVVLLPWTHAQFHARFTPEAAERGLAALALVEGRRAETAPLPPMPNWSNAFFLALPFEDKTLALSFASCLFGTLACLLVYRLGTLWFSDATGLLACALLAINRAFLNEVQTGGPGTIILFFALAALVCFAEHLAREDEPLSRWTFLGGLSIAGLLLSGGMLPLWLAVLGAAIVLFRHRGPRERGVARLLRTLADATSRAGMLTLLVGFGLAAPWLIGSGFHWGPHAPWAEPAYASQRWGLLDAAAAMPATIVCAAFGLYLTLRECLSSGEGAERDALPAIWTLLAAAALAFTQPTAGALLVLLVPLHFLALRTLFMALDRKLSDLAALWLFVGSFLAFAVLQQPAAKSLPIPSTWRTTWVDADWVRLRLAVDAALLAALVAAWIYRLSAGDRYRRAFLGGGALLILALACVPGAEQLRGSPRSDDPWLRVRAQMRQTTREGAPDAVIFVAGPDRALGVDPRLRFLASTVAPRVKQTIVADARSLEQVLLGEVASPLIMVTDPSQRLGRALLVARREDSLLIAERYDSEQAIIYAAARRREESAPEPRRPPVLGSARS